MIDRPSDHRQPDLLVRATNALDPNRMPAKLRTEVTTLLKLLMVQYIAAEVTAPREAADE